MAARMQVVGVVDNLEILLALLVQVAQVVAQPGGKLELLCPIMENLPLVEVEVAQATTTVPTLMWVATVVAVLLLSATRRLLVLYQLLVVHRLVSLMGIGITFGPILGQ
jgi:hypothetical protein